MPSLLPLALAAALAALSGPALVADAVPAPGAVVRLSAPGHELQYLLSLPKGWAPGRKWPVVLAEESAEKDFGKAMQRYVDARGALPFILVMPYSVILGQQGWRDPAVYPYSAATWDRIDAQGTCKFELDGVERMLADVRTRYGGEDKVYATGLEAGAHLVWAMAFRHPEQLAAAAPVAGNYRGRCMEDGAFSADPARAALPLQAFVGAQDKTWREDMHYQFLDARKAAEAHGYTRIGETVVPGHGHEPMAAEVLAWFASLRAAQPR